MTERHGSKPTQNITLKLIRLLDPFGEPDQIRSRMWRFDSLITLCQRLAHTAYLKAFFMPQWYLLFSLSDEMSTSFSSFREITPPKDRFWADPHVVRADGRYYIFVEEYIHKLKKAHISVIEMDGQGNYQGPVRVLERDYHLSYPCVFEWQRQYYMVPESEASASIDLYKCVEFPNKWELEMTLMEGVHAVDTTLLHHGGRWWLFTGLAQTAVDLPLVSLHLFFSDELLTNKWSSHPLNPIVSDVKRGRPAGKVVTMDERLFRPSQECSRGYGYGFDLNEISLLSETEYVERNVLSVRPGWSRKVQATHTFAREGRLTMIDAFASRARFWA